MNPKNDETRKDGTPGGFQIFSQVYQSSKGES